MPNFNEFYEFASFHPFTFCTTTHNSNKVKLDVEIASLSKFTDKGNNRSLSSTHTVVSGDCLRSPISHPSPSVWWSPSHELVKIYSYLPFAPVPSNEIFLKSGRNWHMTKYLVI